MSADPVWPDGYARLVLEETDSTNAHAARTAGEMSGPTWILARRQTAARGRRGRAWAMPDGNFAATLSLAPGGGPSAAALRSFVAALALYEAFGTVGVAPGDCTLKWPNDVLLKGGKVAGILLESTGDGKGGAGRLAVGVGVNLVQAPDPSELEAGAARPVSLRDATGIEVAPEAFLDHLAAAYAGWERQLVTYGFAPVRTAWLARAARLGQRITARTGSETREGVFETLDDTGALVLATRDGRRAIPAADVYFGGA